ncbi:MAG: tRNA ((7)-)-methyltransferase, partial [Pseudomonadota bacterium]
MTRPDHTPPADVAHPQKVRTFVKRAGRTSSGQARAIHTLGAEFIRPYTGVPVHWPDVWGRDWREQPVVLEIGFGMGDATAHIAQVLSDTVFLGCEVHEPGVGALLKLIGERGLRNLRILQHDAVEVLEHMIPPASLDGVHIFFPDPWHKKRHHKRRLIQPPLVQLLCSRLKPGGYVHCATDWAPYAE